MAAVAMLFGGTEGRRRAAEYRAQRAALLNELRDAPCKREALDRCADLLISGDPLLDRVTVIDLVRRCRGVGRDTAYGLLRHAQVDPSVLVGEILIRDAMRLEAVLRSGR